MVSNMGRIKSLPMLISHGCKGQYFRGERILTGAEDAHGYLHVRLKPDDGNKPVLWKIHQLVAHIFLGYQRGKYCDVVVDHIDSNKKNNKLSNLQLADRAWNTITGCHVKMIERRIPTEQYWYENADGTEYGIVLNFLLGKTKFVHFISGKDKMLFDYSTSNRVLYEEAIEEFKTKGIIQ